MDDIVKQALAKWPNVPHCYGWLALDARGSWRMRNEQAQTANFPGDKIVNAALIAFINRNYAHDDQGRWFFQNGPQRVYVDLDALPYIASFHPVDGFRLHIQEAMPPIEKVWMTQSGRLILQSAEKVALLDDRDLALCMQNLFVDGRQITDEALTVWLGGQGLQNTEVMFQLRNISLPVHHLSGEDLDAHFGFVARPRAGAD